MSDAAATPSDEFLATAVRHKLLDESQAHDAQQRADAQGTPAADIVLEIGLLTPTQVDIVQGLMAPDQIAPGFEIQDLLGYGGLGVVYRAKQPRLDRFVALKTIPLRQTSQQGVMARFQQEAQVIGRLHHPHIVSAFDYGTHAGRLFLAMELVQGEDLETRIQREGALAQAVCWGIIRQVAAGLAHAATEGIVHRDIKPANILLTDPPAGFALPRGVPMVKITDFGLARLVTDDGNETRLTMLGTTLGTPQYMAPEQLVAAEVDLRADIYALGATAFHMLCGAPPFGDATTGQILAMKARGEPLTLSALPDGPTTTSANLIAEMTACDPDGRLGDYQVLLDRVDRLLEQSAKDGDRESMAHTAPTIDALKVARPMDAEATAAQRAAGSKRRVRIIAMVAAIGLLALLGWVASRRANSPTTPRLVRSDWQRPLSDGRTLTGWTGMRGQWSYAKNNENALVLTGNGRIERAIPQPDFPSVRQMPNYGISLGIDLNDATEVELQFWDAADATGAVHVLHLSGQGAVLASRNEAGGIRFTSDRIASTTAGVSKPATYEELRIERHGTYWLAFFDDQLVGNAKANGTAGASTFRIVVTGGTAHFDEINVFELVPAERHPS